MTDEPMTHSPTDDKTRLISLSQAAEMYGFSHSFLRQAARTGRTWCAIGNMPQEDHMTRQKTDPTEGRSYHPLFEPEAVRRAKRVFTRAALNLPPSTRRRTSSTPRPAS